MNEIEIMKQNYEQMRGQKVIRYREVQYEDCILKYRTDM